MAKRKFDIYVFADWIGLEGPQLVGVLYAHYAKGKKAFSFKYNNDWLKTKAQRLLDPDIQFYSGPQYPINKENFGVFLDSMNIYQLPESLGKLTNLSQLSLANNPDLDLEQSFGVLSRLPIDFLNLKRNDIKTLPENIMDLKSIKDLNLSYNNLEGAQNFEFLAKLPKLYSLWLDHNKIKELPETIGELDQVRFLYIDHNELSQLPGTMKNMKKVWVIHGGYNKFKELPSVFTEIPGLFMVHMNNNQITMIPEVYQTEKYPLAGLLLDNNPISGVEKEKAKELFKGFFLLSFEQK